MRTLLKISISLLTLVVFAAPALAHGPTASITLVAGIPTVSGFVALRVPYLPYTVPVEGVMHHGKPGTITSTWLSVSDNFLDFFGPEHYFVGAGNKQHGTFTVPWTIDVAGVHFLQAHATHGKGNGDNKPASGTALRSIEVGGLEIEVEVGQ